MKFISVIIGLSLLAGGLRVEAKPWTLVVIPDTQMYFEKPQFIPIFDSMLEWVAAHHEEENIVAVLHVGDVTQQNNARQWTAARKSFAVLDGEVPYFITLGNHDLGDYGAANTRETLFNGHFQLGQNSLNEAAFVASFEEGRLDNAAYQIDVNGETLLILALEFGPRDRVIAWAKQVVSETPHERAILLAHDFIDEISRLDTHDGRPARTNRLTIASPTKFRLANPVDESINCGTDVWSKLVQPHDRFQFVFNGHYGDYVEASENGELLRSRKDIATGYRADCREDGLTVHQLLFNAQFIWTGGDGWMQLVRVDDAAGTISVRTFSPYFQKRLDMGLEAPSPWRTGPDYQFEAPLK